MEYNEDADQAKNDSDKSYFKKDEHALEEGCEHDASLENTSMSLEKCLCCGRDAYDIAGMDG